VNPKDLPKLLQLFSGARVPDDLTRQLLADSESARARLWKSWWHEHPNLVADWKSLPRARQDRIRRAPEAWTLLSGTHYDECNLKGWIEVEQGGRGWSALGDCCSPSFVAPTLPCGMIVDWRSPAALESIPEIRGEAGALCDSEARETCNKVDRALGIIETAAGQWLTLIQQFDAVLLLRKVPSQDSFSSATSRLALGRPVLRNAHLPSASPELIADALIHETVHTIMDHVELTCPVAPGEDQFRDTTLCSGWTGRQLDLNTFVHACLVWFALFHLWLGALHSGAIEVERNVKLLVSRARGFLVQPSRQLTPFEYALAPGVLALVREAETQVLELLA
jgi:hypothetical protein